MPWLFGSISANYFLAHSPLHTSTDHKTAVWRGIWIAFEKTFVIGLQYWRRQYDHKERNMFKRMKGIKKGDFGTIKKKHVHINKFKLNSI